jgi:uncharacterized protein (DUF2267 family)
MTYESFIEEVGWRAGLGERGTVLRAIETTLEIVGERLDPTLVADLAEQLPRPLGEILTRRGQHAAFGVEELYEHVKDQEPVRLGIAVEHARVVCELVAEALDGEALGRLRSSLPAPWAALFVPRARDQPAPSPGPPPGTGHTLASGRPGSQRPLSEASAPAPRRR